MGFIKIGSEIFEMKVYLTEMGKLSYLAQNFVPVNFSLADDDVDYIANLNLKQNVTDISGNIGDLSLSKNIKINNYIINHGSGTPLKGSSKARRTIAVATTTTTTTTAAPTTTTTTAAPTTTTTTAAPTTTTTAAPTTTTTTAMPTTTTTAMPTTTTTTAMPTTTTTTAAPTTTTTTAMPTTTTTTAAPTTQSTGTFAISNSYNSYITNVTGTSLPPLTYTNTNSTTYSSFSNPIPAQSMSVSVTASSIPNIGLHLSLLVDGVIVDCVTVTGSSDYFLTLPTTVNRPSEIRISIGGGPCQQ